MADSNEQTSSIPKEYEEVIRRTAHETAREQWRMIGVDPDDTDDMREFRRDLMFQRVVRERAETVGGYTIKATVTGLVGGILVALWLGIKSKLGDL